MLLLLLLLLLPLLLQGSTSHAFAGEVHRLFRDQRLQQQRPATDRVMATATTMMTTPPTTTTPTTRRTWRCRRLSAAAV
jgi:hypothetical protein